MFEFIFWISIILIFYAYIGYPLTILVLSIFIKNKNIKNDIKPSVTILITAFNEEQDIEDKLHNCFNLDYPKEKLEIVVASDGSTDRTDVIVKQYEENEHGISVVLHRVEGRLGKTAAQNSAVKICKGEIIIFSDAASMYDKNVVRALVRNYADIEVGAVSGRYNYIKEGATFTGLATDLFWRFENFIKGRQNQIKTITGCCGCIYSLRKELYTDLPPEIISDLVEPLTILKKGYRIVFEKDALALEETAGDTKDEFKMRIRVIVRGMNGMLFMKDLFNPKEYPFVAFQLISHKLLRWMVPIFAIFAFISNAFIAAESFFYSFIFILQISLYGLAVAGLIYDKNEKLHKLSYLPLYFCTVNLAALISMYKVVRGENIVIWKTKR